MKKRKRMGKSDGTAEGLIKGTLIFAALYLGLVTVFTVWAYMSDDPTGRTKAFSLAALLLAGLVGGIIVGRRSGERISVISAFLFSVIILALGSIFKKSAPGIGNIINCVIFVGLSFAAAKVKLSGKRHKIKHR